MSTEEFNLIKEIFRLKIEKSNYIGIQNYEYASLTRDLERERERELIIILEKNKSIQTDIYFDRFNQSMVNKIISEYFKNNFHISYPKNLVTEQEQNYYNSFLQRLNRQEKLKELGI
jgi:hypothetical protein